jgi:dephospho-CoA kinase
MTPAGLSHLSQRDRDESLVVYLDMPEDIRRSRMSLRNDADNVERRIKADEVDFAKFDNYDIHIENPEFTLEEFYNTCSEYSEIFSNLMKHIKTPII